LYSTSDFVFKTLIKMKPGLPFLSLIISLGSCKSQQFDGFNTGPKHCPVYNKCSKDEEAVPKWPMKLTSVGCSNLGGSMSMSSIGSDDEIISPCCDQWNACIQICGSTRSFCDSSFDKCLKVKCDDIDNNEEKKKQCESNASTKKLLLSISDCRSFDAGQSNGCECVNKSKVEEKRKSIVRAFYKKYNSKDVDKADKLASKANTIAKFAGLFQKLIEKYPNAVKRVKDPKAKYMEDLLKSHEKGEATNVKTDIKTEDDVVDVVEEEERIEL